MYNTPKCQMPAPMPSPMMPEHMEHMKCIEQMIMEMHHTVMNLNRMCMEMHHMMVGMHQMICEMHEQKN